MRTRGEKLHSDLVETYGGMINDIDARMQRGEEVPDCLVKTLLMSREEEQMDHLDMAILCSAFMIGGVETVRSRCSSSSSPSQSLTLLLLMVADCIDHAVVLSTYPRIP